jgi:hypothetical protein
MRLPVAVLVFAGSSCVVWAKVIRLQVPDPHQCAPWDDQDPCKVEAWVRAQDLHPNAIANGTSSAPGKVTF